MKDKWWAFSAGPHKVSPLGTCEAQTCTHVCFHHTCAQASQQLSTVASQQEDSWFGPSVRRLHVLPASLHVLVFRLTPVSTGWHTKPETTETICVKRSHSVCPSLISSQDNKTTAIIIYWESVFKLNSSQSVRTTQCHPSAPRTEDECRESWIYVRTFHDSDPNINHQT